MLRKLLPFEEYKLATPLTVEEVHQKISDCIEAPVTIRNFLTKWYSKPYKGISQVGSFNIQRVIYYNNSFLPQLNGEAYQIGSKTYIQIKAKPKLIVLLLTLLLLSAFVIIFSLNNTVSNSLNFENTINNYFPIVFFFIFYAIIIFSFRYETRKAKKFLAELLEATIEN